MFVTLHPFVNFNYYTLAPLWGPRIPVWMRSVKTVLKLEEGERGTGSSHKILE